MPVGSDEVSHMQLALALDGRELQPAALADSILRAAALLLRLQAACHGVFVSRYHTQPHFENF